MYKTQVDKEFDDLDIYRFYIGKFSLSTKMLSPLRKETSPSFNIFQTKSGRYFWKDFGINKSGNAINLVEELFGLSYEGAKQKISSDLSGLTCFIGLPNKPSINLKSKNPSVIKIKIKEFTYNDLNYWNQFGITKEILKRFEVFSISHYWIDDHIFEVSNKKLCFAYHFNGKFKIYTPYSDHKWFTNCESNIIQGKSQLIDSDLLIITKSLKDIMTLYSLGFVAIAPQSESIVFDKSIIDRLYSKYDNIITLFDNDGCGVALAEKYERLGMKSIFIPNESLCKDISDYYKQYGKEKTKELLSKLI